MNLVHLLSAAGAADEAERTVRALVEAFSSTAERIASLTTEEVVVLEKTIARANVRCLKDAFGALTVDAIRAVPPRALEQLSPAAREAIFGPTESDDAILFANVTSLDARTFSLGFIVRASAGDRPRVRRIFDPLPFAKLVLEAV